MASIYNVDNWRECTFYKVNNIVKYCDRYYYANSEHLSDTTFQPRYWNGTYILYGKVRPHLFWKPSYGTAIPNQPRIREIVFGDGYSQRIRDGINNNLLKIDATFDNRDYDEATAIAHFLEVRYGVESFVFHPPSPYCDAKLFICKEWTTTLNFYNNTDIKARLEEVAI